MGITRFNAGDGYAHYVGRDGVSLEILPKGSGFLHPFKIKAFKKNGALKATVRAGTANNLVPILDGDDMDIQPPPELTLTDNATNRIYLKAEKGASPVFFPDTLSVITSTSVQSDTNDEGYLLLGSVTTANGKITAVNQYVYASQVVVRAKPGSATALWNWSSR